MSSRLQELRRGFRRLGRSDEGAAAVEFALVLGLLTVPLLNVIDLAKYAFDAMQTQNAAQMGAQAAASNCNSLNLMPASTQCLSSNSTNSISFYSAVNQGIQETQLGSAVKLSGSQIVEGYYCSSKSSNILTLSGTAGYATNSTSLAPSTTATNCNAAGGDSKTAPVDYVKVSVSHSYTSIFPLVSVVALLPKPMTATAYARLG
jgi:Flp pilus assembly protein TadG